MYLLLPVARTSSVDQQSICTLYSQLLEPSKTCRQMTTAWVSGYSSVALTELDHLHNVAVASAYWIRHGPNCISWCSGDGVLPDI